jgi:hypothetical protein
MSKWKEQYDRVTRWHARFASLDAGQVHDRASDNYIDDIYAFFQNCYHLKDWIKNDLNVDVAARKSVETFVSGERSLSLCADVCNALKHLTLSSPPRSGEQHRIGKRDFAVDLGSPVRISLHLTIETDSGAEDAYQLASQCVSAWNTFLRTWQLLK